MFEKSQKKETRDGISKRYISLNVLLNSSKTSFRRSDSEGRRTFETGGHIAVVSHTILRSSILRA